MITTVSTKGQIVLPVEIRQQDGIEPGQEFDIERIDRGRISTRAAAVPPEGRPGGLAFGVPGKGFLHTNRI
jgi:AbrB family looped-hinge helix DNA binding protein